MNAPNGSEGARPALLSAGPVPERSNVKKAPLESGIGQRLAERVCSQISCGRKSSILESIRFAPSVEALDRFMGMRQKKHKLRHLWDEAATHRRRLLLGRDTRPNRLCSAPLGDHSPIARETIPVIQHQESRQRRKLDSQLVHGKSLPPRDGVDVAPACAAVPCGQSDQSSVGGRNLRPGDVRVEDRVESKGSYILANVPDHLLSLAFGADPASAGSVTKVPKAW